MGVVERKMNLKVVGISEASVFGKSVFQLSELQFNWGIEFQRLLTNVLIMAFLSKRSSGICCLIFEIRESAALDHELISPSKFLEQEFSNYFCLL